MDKGKASGFGDVEYQAFVAEESARGVSDSELEELGHDVYASDVDTAAVTAELETAFIEAMDGPLIPKFTRDS